ncbi:HotDog domain-containing protein [Penicillium crustosum]|uniref:HotDog domain-containing protein n=1 Tax=Penicillium crustosum TaxID=36656 RepID=UPI002397127A|nr:HotDog domain-containing protein [Penicillium crustosum]KAJ5417031.1 HotDog domain-containing protein [Penicillium crustosum]
MVFPTYPLLLPFKLTDQEVVEFYNRNATNTIPGAPDLDLRYAVDGQRELTIYKPLPTASTGSKFELQNKVIGIYDKGSAGSAFDTEQTIVDSVTGEVYTTTRSVSFVPKQGNWGGPRVQILTSVLLASQAPKCLSILSQIEHQMQDTKSKPRITRFFSTGNDIRFIIVCWYLNGDYNPLHAVPGPGLEMGLGGVIIHGLFTYSSTCYGVVSKMCGGDASRLKSFGARFASPVKPGDKLTTTMWSMGMTDGLEELRFITKNQESRTVLSNGRALLLPRISLSNL